MGMTSGIILIYSIVTAAFPYPLLNIERISFPQWLFTNAELIPLLPALLIVGGFILITLSYVSWRKYKGEKIRRGRKTKGGDKIVDWNRDPD
ncbi:sporulation protein YpjB [Oceanobacillus sp. AG]|uniref:sporulation protein YpjB n=1 Tax=Oceanobacillus sp. AG TaxID=2681969 RepID=UPI0012EBC9A4